LTQISHSPLPTSRLSFQSLELDASRPHFVKNEIVKGIVLKSISSKSVMMMIKGKRVIANTRVPLNEGSAVTLKVEKTYPDPILKLMKIESKGVDTINTSMILNGIKKNLWKEIIENVDQSPLSIKEKELLRELVLDTSKKLLSKPTPESIIEFIDKSGLGWENKIRELLTSKTHPHLDIQKLLTGDLKGIISKLITSTSGNNEHFNRFVSMIQNIQLLNHFGFEQDGKIFIPLPLQFPDGYFTVGQLLIHSDQHNNDRRKEKAKESGFFRISFLLQLSSLGPLRADLAVQGKQISGRFLTVKKETKYILEKSLPSLIDALNKRGFSISHLECHVKEAKQVNDTLIKEIIQEESCNISVVV
jgi:Flagellar hook-length control protein FliK